MGNTTSARSIQPMIDIDIKNGKDTVIKVLSIMFSNGKVNVSYGYECDGIPKFILYQFKKGCNENDVWEYLEDYITKIIKENEEIMILNNFRNRGFSYCFNKETQETVGTYIKLLVRCLLKCDMLYMGD